MDTLIYKLTFILTFLGISIFTVRHTMSVKTVDDFSVAGRSLSGTGVSWIIIGTLVGGVSTIGTVQTAYTHGITAGIFTFGSALSCLLLGCFFAKALREEQVVTVSEYLGKYFGPRFRTYCSAVNSTGMFIHVVGQFLASMAILQAVFSFDSLTSLLITILLIGIFVVSGGVTGAGLIGKIKFYMLYAIMIISAISALSLGGGLRHITAALPSEADMLGFGSYGVKTTVMDIVSMIIGVLSTQIYLQAIFSAKDVRAARNGAFLSAALIPPIGVLGIIIGLYLRANCPELAANPAQALPWFFQHAFQPIPAALCSAGILLVVLGTGAGLVLGVTTNLYNDVIIRLAHKPKIEAILMIRISSLVILILAALLVLSGLDSAILKWSYLSMGLRGSAVFAGMFILVFCKKIASSKIVLVFLYLLPGMYLLLTL